MCCRWDPKKFVIKDGRDGGPTALFDTDGRAVFISPFDQFMSASVWHDKSNARYYWGIMGGVESIPKSFAYHTIIYYSAEGINSVSFFKDSHVNGFLVFTCFISASIKVAGQ